MNNQLIKVALGDLGVTVTGKTPSSKTPSHFGGDYMFITPTDNFDEKFITKTERYLSEKGKKSLSTKLLPKNSVMVTCIGSAMGKVSLNATPAVTNQQINSIILNTERFSPSYIYYTLRNNYSMLRNAATGSTAVPLLNKTDFDKLTLIIHEDLGAQNNIVTVLSALDDKIELNRKINAELEQMARTLYDYWFVQFDFPDASGKPYKSSGGAMKSSPELNREIPQGWSAVKAGDALDIQLGGTPSRKVPAYWNQGMIPWLSSGEVANFPIINSVEYITESGVLNSAAKVLPSGSIMISITGNIRVSVLAIDAAANQSVVGVIPKDLLSTPYLYSYFQQLIPEYEAKMTGAVQKHINKEAVESTYVLRPEDNILLRYNDLINPIFAKIIANRQQSQNLAHLRDWLLPMLMNGQVKVI